MSSETEDDEYAYSSDEDNGYPIADNDDESSMDWKKTRSENPNAAPTRASNKCMYDNIVVTGCIYGCCAVTTAQCISNKQRLLLICLTSILY